MYISEIQLVNYRNYEKLNLYPSKDINLVYGKNAQGKTNLLESIYLISTGRSHKAIKDKYIIKENELGYYIKIKGFRENIPFKIECKYIKGDKKRFKVNNLEIKKIGEIIGLINTVIFSPEDLQIIKQGPSERRRFLDILISQSYPIYFYKLQKYNKIIKQKNSLLKKFDTNIEYKEILDIYNNQLGEIAYELINERIFYISEIEKYFKIYVKKLTNSKENGNLSYISTLGYTKKEIIKTLNDSKYKEIKNRNSIIGPHRDDLEIFINNRNIKIYGSQGQQRTAILALKLAEIEVIKEKTGYYPILLLDDVMSELDISRRKLFTQSINTKQTFISSTEKKNYSTFINKTTFFYVSDGKIEKR